MQPINIFNSQDVKVTIDENGTPVDVYISGGTATELQFYSTFSALPSPGQGGIIYITEDTNFIYRWDGSYIQIGGGSPSLQDVTDVGNITTNDIQLINDADVILGAGGKVLMDNGSKLQEGTTDAGNGGSKGIALKCSVDYELKWEAGRLYTMEQDGFTIREVSHNFTFAPSFNDDSLKGFTIGSRWILDNGDIYTCSDATSGAAVWSLEPAKVPYTGATGNINIGVYNIVANDGTSDSEFAPNFVGVENASGYTVIDPTGLYTADGSGQMEVNAQGLVFPDASVQTTAGISGVDWGDIQGTLSYQTDLQTALDGKVDENSAITGATKTKITYDSKGLVTSGADAAISDISGLQTTLDGKVPYTGATGNVNLGEYGLTGGYYQFDTTPTTYTQAVGNVGWNDTDGTIETLLKGGSVVLEIGQKLVARVVNGTGGNVLRSNYQVVKVTGAQGQRLQINLAQGNNDANSADTLGLIAENISNNQTGFIVTSGIISEINTTGSLQSETWADGDPLYLSPTTAGKVTNIKPQAPNHTVIVGFVVYAHSVHGKIFVKIDNGYELDELHNVKINTPLNGQVLRYNGTTFVWENSNDSDNLTFNAPLSRSVNAISISQASGSTNGYLSSTDFTTFNNKQNTLTNPVTGTGTANSIPMFTGTTSVGNAPLTIGTTGEGLSIEGGVSFGGGSLNFKNYSSVTTKGVGYSSISTNTSKQFIFSYEGSTSVILDLTNITGGKTYTMPNVSGTLLTGTGTSGQVAYWNGTSSQTGSATFTFSPTAQLLVNNSITASSAIARGVNLTPTLTAAANNDVLVGLDISPTFTNGAFTGVKNYALRVQGTLEVTPATGITFGGGLSALTYSGSQLHLGNNAGWDNVRIFSGGALKYTSTSTLTSISNTTINLSTANLQLAGVGVLKYSGTDLQFGSVDAGFNSTTFYSAGSIVGRYYSTGNWFIGSSPTDSGYKLDVNGTARVQGQWNVTGSTTASSAIARGAYYTPTLVAAANNDVLVGLDINPTFTNGAFTGVTNTYIRALGTSSNVSITNNAINLTDTRGGTNTPAITFTVGVTGNSQVIIGNSSYPYAGGANSFNIYHALAGPIVFYNGTTPTRRMSILSDGKVVIGTANSATRTFEVNASGNGDGIQINATNQNAGILINHTAAGANTWGFNSAATGSSQTAGTLAIGSNFLLFSNGNTVLGPSTSTDSGYKLDVNGTLRSQGDFTLSDAKNLILGTTTGTKIGTATSQKIGFWNATPIVQPTTAVTASTLVSNLGTPLTDTDTFDGYTLKQIVKALRNTGILA